MQICSGLKTAREGARALRVCDWAMKVSFVCRKVIYFDKELAASLCVDKLVFRKRSQGYGWVVPATFFVGFRGRCLFVTVGLCQGRSVTELGKFTVVLTSLVGLQAVNSFYCSFTSRIATVRHVRHQ